MGGIFFCFNGTIIKSSFMNKEELVIRIEKNLDLKLNQKAIKSIFKIKIKDEVFKKGFLCNIPLKQKGENETMNSIFINDYLINEYDNLFGNEIEFHFYNDKKIKIQIDNSRKIYIIKKYKISIIEIKKEEKFFNDISFLEIENDIKKDKINVYLLNFLDGKNEINISNGEISNISDNNFNHTCPCNENSKYDPIINSSNNKIIGIHNKNEKGNNFNNGILIKYLLDEIEDLNYIYLNKKKYIKSILLSFYKIEKLKTFFFQEDINENDKTKELTYLIVKYMKDYESKNSNNCDKIIIDLEKKINLKDLKFENLINYILRTLHQELNSKIISNNPPPLDDTDEKISYNNFLKYYNDQNESIIKNLFFGFKEITKLYQCCYITKYKFEVCEYINFDFNEINKDLQNIMIEWENHQKEEEDKCSMCLINSNTLIQYQLYYGSEILIIINNNKSEVKFDSIIKTKKYVYKLISCIIESKEPTDFSVIFNYQNKWHIIENDNIKEFNNNKIIPYVLFCIKIKEFNNNESKITLLTEISHNNIENNSNNVNVNIIKENNTFGLNHSDNNEKNNIFNNNITNNNNININNNIKINNNINNIKNLNNSNNSKNNNMINNNNDISTNNNSSNIIFNNLNNDNKINKNINMSIKYSKNQNNNLINNRNNNSLNMIFGNNQILNDKNQIYYSYNQNYKMNNYYNNNFNQSKYNINYNCNNITMNNNNNINNIYSYNNYNINMCPNFMGISNFQNNYNNINNKLNNKNNNDNSN